MEKKTMKAAVVRAFGQPLSIEDVPIPIPGPGEVLVKIMASGVCHTDLHALDGDWPVKPTLPFIPGHEGAGIVAGMGAGVTSVKKGDAVGIAWLHDACGLCEFCITGWETLCAAQRNSGYSINGTFADTRSDRRRMWRASHHSRTSPCLLLSCVRASRPTKASRKPRRDPVSES